MELESNAGDLILARREDVRGSSCLRVQLLTVALLQLLDAGVVSKTEVRELLDLAPKS